METGETADVCLCSPSTSAPAMCSLRSWGKNMHHEHACTMNMLALCAFLSNSEEKNFGYPGERWAKNWQTQFKHTFFFLSYFPLA